MKKIPTLFLRDPDDMRRVLPEVHPDCQWVLDGEGVATRKYDGTCLFMDGQGDWWARREVKPGRKPPENWWQVDLDEATGKAQGWEPVDQTGWGKYLDDALGNVPGGTRLRTRHTYELCGPKVNGNPEHFPEHRLIRHGDAEVIPLPGLSSRLTYVEARTYLAGTLTDLHERAGCEGIVWHHPDGRMAKLKARDFRFDPEGTNQ